VASRPPNCDVKNTFPLFFPTPHWLSLSKFFLIKPQFSNPPAPSLFYISIDSFSSEGRCQVWVSTSFIAFGLMPPFHLPHFRSLCFCTRPLTSGEQKVCSPQSRNLLNPHPRPSPHTSVTRHDFFANPSRPSISLSPRLIYPCSFFWIPRSFFPVDCQTPGSKTLRESSEHFDLADTGFSLWMVLPS